jgi:hypothetical protein
MVDDCGIPACAGMGLMQWIPAFAGMTVKRAGTVETSFQRRPKRRIGTPHRAGSREVDLESFLRRFPVVVG